MPGGPIHRSLPLSPSSLRKAILAIRAYGARSPSRGLRLDQLAERFDSDKERFITTLQQVTTERIAWVWPPHPNGREQEHERAWGFVWETLEPRLRRLDLPEEAIDPEVWWEQTYGDWNRSLIRWDHDTRAIARDVAQNALFDVFWEVLEPELERAGFPEELANPGLWGRIHWTGLFSSLAHWLDIELIDIPGHRLGLEVEYPQESDEEPGGMRRRLGPYLPSITRDDVLLVLWDISEDESRERVGIDFDELADDWFSLQDAPPDSLASEKNALHDMLRSLVDEGRAEEIDKDRYAAPTDQAGGTWDPISTFDHLWGSQRANPRIGPKEAGKRTGGRKKGTLSEQFAVLKETGLIEKAGRKFRRISGHPYARVALAAILTASEGELTVGSLSDYLSRSRDDWKLHNLEKENRRRSLICYTVKRRWLKMDRELHDKVQPLADDEPIHIPTKTWMRLRRCTRCGGPWGERLLELHTPEGRDQFGWRTTCAHVHGACPQEPEEARKIPEDLGPLLKADIDWGSACPACQGPLHPVRLDDLSDPSWLDPPLSDIVEHLRWLRGLVDRDAAEVRLAGTAPSVSPEAKEHIGALRSLVDDIWTQDLRTPQGRARWLQLISEVPWPARDDAILRGHQARLRPWGDVDLEELPAILEEAVGARYAPPTVGPVVYHEDRFWHPSCVPERDGPSGGA